MTSIVTITEATRDIMCGADGRGEHVFTITNTNAVPLRVGVRFIVDDQQQEQWLKIEGEAERDLAGNAADQFTVRVQVPPETPEGKHNFRLLVYSTKDPGERFTEGPTVSFQVPKQPKPEEPPKTSFPWWIVAVVAGVLLLGGGGAAAYFLWPDGKVAVPEIIGQTVDEAVVALEQTGLKGGAVTKEKTADVPPGTITKQDPKAGVKVEKGSTIALVVAAAATVPVPSVIGKSVDQAKRILVQRGLKLGGMSKRRSTKRVGTVIQQSPAANTAVKPGSRVALVVAIRKLVLPGKPITPLRYTYTATTFKAVRRSGNVRAGSLTWRCGGQRCTISGPWRAPAVGACKVLARQVGRIRYYGRPGRRLTSTQLRQCNIG